MSFHLRANSTCPHVRQTCYTILVSAQEEASKIGEDSGKGNKIITIVERLLYLARLQR